MNPALRGIRTHPMAAPQPHHPADGKPPGAAKLRKLESILARLALGLPGAMEELYDATSAMVYSLAERLLRDPFQAEEALLDVYRYAWQSAELYDPKRGSVKSWLLSITRGRSIDRLRASATRRQKEQTLTDLTSSNRRGSTGRDCGDWELEASASTDPAEGPPEQLLSGERSHALESALLELPPKQRRVIELAFLYGKSHPAIAEEVQEPLGTIKSQIRRGLIRLHELLNTQCSFGHPS